MYQIETRRNRCCAYERTKEDEQQVMDRIDLSRYFVERIQKTGRPRCEKLLKMILFAFLENGICSFSELEKLCRNDIR